MFLRNVFRIIKKRNSKILALGIAALLIFISGCAQIPKELKGNYWIKAIGGGGSVTNDES